MKAGWDQQSLLVLLHRCVLKTRKRGTANQPRIRRATDEEKKEERHRNVQETS